MNQKRTFPVWAALICAGLAGVLVAAQSRINGGLGQSLDNGYVAALISFGVGLVLLTLMTLFSRRSRAGLSRLVAEVRSGRYPVWGLLGGTCGAAFVLSQSMIAPVIGLALFTVGIVAGQVLGGLGMDRIGLGPGGRVDPTAQRLIGTALAVVAVVVSVGSDLGSGAGPQVWLVLLPLVAGVGMSWQSAVNGLVRAAAQSSTIANLVNFIVGTAVLTVAAGVSVAVKGLPQEWPSEPILYVGGIVGVIFIAVATTVVRITGVLLLSMSTVAGQLVGSVLLDASLPLAHGLTVGLVIGAIVALVAVAIAALPGRRARG